MEYLDLEQSATFRKNYRIYTAVTGTVMADVGRKVGMRTNTLSQIIDGKRHVLLEAILAREIARAIGVNMEHMLREQLLHLDPKVKDYLGKEENLAGVYALMEYTKTGNLEELLRNLMDAKKKKA